MRVTLYLLALPAIAAVCHSGSCDYSCSCGLTCFNHDDSCTTTWKSCSALDNIFCPTANLISGINYGCCTNSGMLCTTEADCPVSQAPTTAPTVVPTTFAPTGTPTTAGPTTAAPITHVPTASPTFEPAVAAVGAALSSSVGMAGALAAFQAIVSSEPVSALSDVTSIISSVQGEAEAVVQVVTD